MSRKIKFRAWDKKTKEYFHISELWNSGTNPECFNFDGWTDNFGNKGRLKDIVIEQYTGVKDINGKDIYENDIVQFPILGKPHKEIVVWSAQDASFIVGMMYLSRFQPKMEVLGNVHQDGYLLEAEH